VTDTRRLPWQLENRIRMKHADAFYRICHEAYMHDRKYRAQPLSGKPAADWAMDRTLNIILMEVRKWYNEDNWRVELFWNTPDQCHELRLFRGGKTVAVYMQYSWHRIGLQRALEACGVQYSYHHWPQYYARGTLQPIS
jgi:hypothetical protein